MSKWFNNSRNNKHRKTWSETHPASREGWRTQAKAEDRLEVTQSRAQHDFAVMGRISPLAAKFYRVGGNFKYECVQTIWSCTTNITLHIVGVRSIADLGTSYQMQSKKWRVSFLSFFLLPFQRRLLVYMYEVERPPKTLHELQATITWHWSWVNGDTTLGSRRPETTDQKMDWVFPCALY